jgi:hypothetical protein
VRVSGKPGGERKWKRKARIGREFEFILKIEWTTGTVFYGSVQREVVGCFAYGYGLLGSIKCGKCFDYLKTCQVSKRKLL